VNEISLYIKTIVLLILKIDLIEMHKKPSPMKPKQSGIQLSHEVSDDEVVEAIDIQIEFPRNFKG
jgi:hypothetical protein